jgi:hypothetical protein
MVEVVGSDNLVLNAFVIKLDCVLCVVASENKEVFDRKLVQLRPAYL